MIKDMDKQFNFEQVGKRMPYNVPDGFFDQLEQNVMAEVMADNTATDKPRQKARTLKIAIRTILAAAAAVTLFFVVTKNMPSDTTEDSFANVELAYNNLSPEDQEFLIEIYEEDVFMIENEEMDY
jgi:hypothetical protein